MIEAIVLRMVSGLVGRLILGGIAVIATVRYGTGIYVWKETEQLERPKYTVIQTLSDGVEVRQYEPYIVAETTVDGSGFRESTGEGFRTCAGYIFGKNKPKRRGSADEGEKMAMTAPVRVSGNAPRGEKMSMTAPVRLLGRARDKTKVSFVMGSNYTLRDLPKPVDKNIKLRKVPAHTLAVRTFSGPPPRDERVVKERARIERTLEKAGIRWSNKETLVYGYHDPFITPNFLRRSEVAVVVEGRA